MKVILLRGNKIFGCVDINSVKFFYRKKDCLHIIFIDGKTVTMKNLKEQDFEYVFKQVKDFNDNQNRK